MSSFDTTVLLAYVCFVLCSHNVTRGLITRETSKHTTLQRCIVEGLYANESKTSGFFFFFKQLSHSGGWGLFLIPGER